MAGKPAKADSIVGELAVPIALVVVAEESFQLGCIVAHPVILARMTENECGVETQKDGTLICSLHKEPITETTRLDEVSQGMDFPEGSIHTRTFFCPVAKKEFTIVS
jgi:hypothetical protein